MSKNEVIFEIEQEIIDNIRKTFNDRSMVEIGLLKMDKQMVNKATSAEFGNFMPINWAMERWFFAKTGRSFRNGKTHIAVPQRSFLRKTVSHKAGDFISWLDAAQGSILESIVTGSWRVQLGHFGQKWVMYIKECFATRGFGQWAPLSSFTVMMKGHDTPLIETGALESRIDSQVVGK